MNRAVKFVKTQIVIFSECKWFFRIRIQYRSHYRIHAGLPPGTKGRALLQLVLSAVRLVAIYFLINAPDLFVAAESSSPQLQGLMKTINYWVHIGLLITALVIVIKTVVEVFKLVGRRLAQVHQATVGS